ncbi:uncharacterized protein LJ206_013013 isoform 1-T1 [Theristicus caerulescens]
MKTHLSEYIVLGNFSKWSINSFLSTKHLIEQGRKWTGKSYTTTQGEAEVLTIFPWHLTFLRRRCCSVVGAAVAGIWPPGWVLENAPKSRRSEVHDGENESSSSSYPVPT